MPRVIGDVAVVINPDATGFRQFADAQLKKQLAGFRPNIKLGADAKEINATIADLRAKIATLSKGLSDLRIGAKDAGAEAAVTRLQARLSALVKQAAEISLGGDTKKLDAAIAREKAELARLRQQMSDLQLDADDKKAAYKIASLEAEAFHLDKALAKMTADVDIKKAEARLRQIDAELRVLKSNAQAVAIGADNKALLKAITVSEAKITEMQQQARDIKLGGNIDTAKLLAVQAGVLGIQAAMEKLAPAAQTGDAALGVLGKALVGTGTGWGFLTRSVVLFGGVFNRVLPVVAASVAVWHILLDAIIEIGAVWIPASLAVGAFAVAASDAAKEIVNRMNAVHTVMDATGRSVTPMTNAMENLHKAVRPQVYQLFGDALTIMNSRAGTFALVAKATGTVLDQLGARITYAVTSSNKLGQSTHQLSGFWLQAVTDVSKLGDSIGNVFGIFGNLFRAIPGFAAGLLTIGDDFTKILEAASAAAVPLLKWVLLLHGYILYTGLAVTASLAFIGAMANLAKQFITFATASVLAGVTALKTFASTLVTIGLAIAAYVESIIVADGATASFAAALAPLATNPMIWVTAAAVALGGLAFWLVTSKDAAQSFNDTMQKTIQNAQLSSVVSTIQSAQVATAARLAGATRQVNSALKDQGPAIQGVAGHFEQNYNPALDRAATLQAHYQQGLTQLQQQQQLVTGRVGALSKQFGGQAQALGALNAAGITTAQITDKNSEHWAQALIQVNSTVQAYQAMGTQAGVLGNDLDVLGRTATDQYQAIQKLNQAWTGFISDVTGTQGSFDTVIQGFSTLNDHSGTLRLTLGKLKVAYTDTHAAIDDLSPAGIALNQAFGDQVQNVDKLFASWRTAGLAGNLFTEGVKSAIAPLTRYASGSQEATAQLVALAEEAGYQGPISMAALTKWLGNTRGATQRLKDITDQATIQEALLTGAMQAQADFITTQLSRALTEAILSYDGVQKAVSDYGTAVARSGKDSQDAKDKLATAVGAIVKSELSMGDNAQQMAAVVAKTFGISMPQAFDLVRQSLGNLADKTLPGAKAQFRTFAEVGLSDTKKQADELWNQIATKLGPKLDGLGNLAGGAAKKKFIDWAENGLHLSQQKANALWNELVTLQNHIDNLHGKNVGVNFVGSGTGSIAFKESIPGVTTGPSSQGILGFHAAGGRIPGFAPGVDNYAAMLSGGEFILTPEAASSVGYDALDQFNRRASAGRQTGTMPGFAAGGIAGGTGSAMFSGLDGPTGVLTSGQARMAKVEAAFGEEAEKLFAQAAIAKFKKDMNALGGSGSAIVSYARSFLGKIPYVFGGNSLSGGIDCSGFTQAVYSKFGISAPRTSEAQYAWATRSSPVPGGLAFYVSPAGGPPPGHVAIVQDAGSVISQGGGMGPTIEAMHFLPLMGTGVPKGGFPASAGGAGNAAIGPSGSLQAIAMALLRQYGWGSQWPAFNSLETREAGWNMHAVNPSSGAAGLAQFINGWGEYFQYGGNPSTALGQLTAMMNYIGQRYPSGPNEAWAHEVAFNWYGKGGLVPGMAAGGKAKPKAPAKLQFGPWLGQLRTAQQHEVSDYNWLQAAFYSSLVHARPGSWTWKNRTALRERLYAVGKRQGAEAQFYKALLSHSSGSIADLTALPNRIGALDNTIAAELDNLQPGLLGHTPGGHPSQVKNLQAGLRALQALTQNRPYNPPWAPGNLGASHTAPGGVLKFDTGRGVLAPGMNYAWNGTGRPEALSASGAGGGGDIHLHVHNSGVIASQQQTDAWMQASLNRMARSGYLGQAVKRAGGH